MFSIKKFWLICLSIVLIFVQIDGQGVELCQLPIPSEGIQLSCSKGWLRRTWNNCSGSHTFGTKLQLNCKDGFVQSRAPGPRIQNPIYICDYDGAWSGHGLNNMSDFSCVKIDKAQDFEHGKGCALLPTEYEGVKFSCSTGWMRKIWSNDCSGSHSVGTQLKLSCMDGFVNADPVAVAAQNHDYNYICDYDGAWSGLNNISDFSCVKNRNVSLEKADTDAGLTSVQSDFCPRIETKTLSEGVQLACEHGQSHNDVNNCSEPQLTGTKAIIGCREFYVAENGGRESKNIVLRCDKNGKWTGMEELRNFTCKQDCGLRSGKKNPFIAYGNVTDQESWPWHAAIFRKKGNKFYYICGGSLITESLIITAAHCVTDIRTTIGIPTEHLLVRLGSKSNVAAIKHTEEDVSLDSFVKEIYVHPTYDQSFQADIAILQLSKSVIFNKFMAPVCLPESISMDNRALETGNYGDVVGFGNNENGSLSNELRHAVIPVAQQRDCYRDLGSKLTESQICMGVGKGGENVCQGDSGSGLTVPNEFRTSSYLHGIVSWGTGGLDGKHILEKSECKSNVVFTRVFSFLPWILQKINDVTGERRILASEKTNIFTERGTDENYKRFNVILRNNERVSGLHLQYEDIDPKILLDGFLERTSGDIETIELESVEISSEFERKIRLPFLKTLRVDRIVPDWDSEDWVSRLDEFVYSTVFVKTDTEWNLSEIAHLNINIDLLLNLQRVFKIDHQVREIVSSVTSISSILSNLPSKFSLKFLTLADAPGSVNAASVNESLLPRSLTYLKVLHIFFVDEYGTQSDILTKIFKRCSNITTFIYKEFPYNQILLDEFKNVDVSGFLNVAPNLKKLYIADTNVTSSGIESQLYRSNNVESLVFSKCNFSVQFVQEFNQLFSSVKEIYLDEPMNNELKRIIFKSSAQKIVIFEEKDKIYQIIKDYDMNTYYELENFAETKRISTQKLKLCFVFERNNKGIWVLTQIYRKSAGDLIFSHLAEDERLFSSNLEIVAAKRLTAKEKYLIENPEKTYKLYGTYYNAFEAELEKRLYFHFLGKYSNYTLNPELEKRSYFNGLPDDDSFLIPSELTKMDIDRAYVPVYNLVTALSETWNLEHLELTEVELQGTVSNEDRPWLPHLKTYKLLHNKTIDFGTLVNNNDTLTRLIPFYKHHKQWKVEEVLLLGVDISMGNYDVNIFNVNHDAGIFTSLLTNTNEILRMHKKYSDIGARLSICELYEFKNYGDDEKSCEILTSRPGVQKYYKYVINYLRIAYCMVNIEYIPKNLTGLRLSNVELLGNGSLTDIFGASKNLEIVLLYMGFRVHSSISLTFDSLVDKYSLDISELNISTLKYLSLYGVSLTHSKPNLNLPVFNQIMSLSINRCNVDKSTMEHIFEIFPCKLSYLFWLKHEQYGILEQVITSNTTAAEIKIIILVKSRDDSMLYSENLLAFLKSLNLYYENKNYFLYLERINDTWNGSTKVQEANMGEFDKDPWVLFNKYPY